jgi:tripartite-type tricarboxylate transporter receptor subunit TctC
MVTAIKSRLINSRTATKREPFMVWAGRLGFVAVYALLGLPAANAQAYPERPIRIILPVAPGGSADLVARTIGAKLSESLGKPFIVESRVGGGGELALESVIRSAPDGYTLLSSPNGPISVAPHVQRPKYDVAKDFTPVAMQVFVGAGIAVNAALPIYSMNDLIKTAKEHPEGFNFAHSGVGNTMHLAGELLKSRTGTNLVAVPYRGTSPAVTAILTGEVPFGIADLTSIIPLADAGRVRILAVMNSSRIGIAPDVPTAAEAGLPGYSADPWIGLFAPAGTPSAIVERINAEVARALARPEVRDNFVKAGLQPAPMTPDETRRFVLDDIEKWGKLIRSINLRPQ